ncbi:hypothetical protein [uncultured Algoriphagus sp.]|uniref:hypothetical protein n=1 Tax=uncultured Algoriphagus sp. TaxID=417365 RepID=UPI00258E53E2|nr:hypothetical protein [uncultured Algoriphagus sp.]
MSDRMGICNICGSYKQLTKEHVPPKKAFNNGRWTEYLYEENQWADNPLILPKNKRINQGGITFFSICGKCNNDTGRWYARSFSDFCHYNMDILRRVKGRTSLYVPNEINPLRVIKQIITMFFAINDNEFRIRHINLVKFILNQDEYPLPPEYKVLAYYKVDENLRYIQESFIGNFKSGPKPIMITEISHPPFGFLLTNATDKNEIDTRLENITYFSFFPIEEKRLINLKLNTLPTVINIPGDYRSKKEIEEAIMKSKSRRK